jgi:hypothetical protein
VKGEPRYDVSIHPSPAHLSYWKESNVCLIPSQPTDSTPHIH